MVFLEQSANSLCLLYVLWKLGEAGNISKEAMSRMFRVVVMEGEDRLVELLLERIGLVGMESVKWV